MPTGMTAPNIGAVKSLAKSIRVHLPDAASINHMKSLEIAASAFGYSSWHACRKGLSVKNPDFSEKTDITHRVKVVVDKAARICICVRKGPVATSMVSSLRSPLFLGVLALLGFMSQDKPFRFIVRDNRAENLKDFVNRKPERSKLTGKLVHVVGNPLSKFEYLNTEDSLVAHISSGLDHIQCFSQDGLIDLDYVLKEIEKMPDAGLLVYDEDDIRFMMIEAQTYLIGLSVSSTFRQRWTAK